MTKPKHKKKGCMYYRLSKGYINNFWSKEPIELEIELYGI